MKRSKIALALTVAVSMLSLTACNDDDDSPASNQKQTYVSEIQDDGVEGCALLSLPPPPPPLLHAVKNNEAVNVEIAKVVLDRFIKYPFSPCLFYT